MALDALLARLEGQAVTPVTADVMPDVTPKPAPMLACTLVTPVTSENDDTAGMATSEPLSDPAAEARRQRLLEKQLPSESAIELFEFTPPGDPANDDEALQERSAILAVENGWNDATALQEARWQADRERCWRAFLRNAARILAAPAHDWEGLLRQYQEEAGQLYGAPTALDMAQSLYGWVRARAVH